MPNIKKNRGFINRILLVSTLLVLVAGCSGNNQSALLDNKTGLNGQLEDKTLKRISEESFAGWKDPALAPAAMYSGRVLLADLAMAERALSALEADESRKYLNAARELAVNLKAIMPLTIAVDEVHDAEGKYLGTMDSEETDTMLPIYQSLHQMQIFAPELVKKSQFAPFAGNAAGGLAPKEKMAPLAEDILANMICLPVTHVSEKIDNALSAMDESPENFAEAREHVDQALSSLVALAKNTFIVKENNRPEQVW